MAAKMAFFYKKYKKIFPKTSKPQGFCMHKSNFTDS